jgi:methionyl aminopeptidase
MIIKKTRAEIERWPGRRRRRPGARGADGALKPGMTTLDLDRIAEEVIVGAGAVPSFKGYRGLPGDAVHLAERPDRPRHPVGGRRPRRGRRHLHRLRRHRRGLPRRLGDHADRRGRAGAPPRSRDLVRQTRNAMWRGSSRPSTATGSATSAPPSRRSPRHGYGVVREYVGHGIGRALHEDPSVPTTGGGQGAEDDQGLGHRHRADVQPRHGARPAPSTTSGPW